MSKSFASVIRVIYADFEAGVDAIWEKCVVSGVSTFCKKFLAKAMRYDEAEEEQFRKMVFWGVICGLI